MSAPTLWEEGQWSARRVTGSSALGCLLLAAANLAATSQLDLIFDVGFVLLCVAGALLVHPRFFFRVAVMPPLLLVGVAVLLTFTIRSLVVGSGAGAIESVMSLLVTHSAALFIGYAGALGVLLIRNRVIRSHPARSYPDEDYSNLAVAPPPTRVTTAEPEEKSTTVVGSEPHSPQSTTASSH